MTVPPTLQSFRSRGLALLAIVAPALGGSVEPWARGTLIVASGVVLLATPPRRNPGLIWVALATALLGFALTAFLPANWLPLLNWRAAAGEVGLVLPGTVTPQPWVSIEAIAQFAASLAFALALAAHHWECEDLRAAIRWYGAGTILLAALAVGAQRAGWHVPWWPATGNSVTGFGFFPNRNQTANVIALGGIVVLGLAFDDLRRRRWTGYAWCAGLLLLGFALVETQSRAGIGLLLGGGMVWVLFPLRFSSAKQGVTLGFAAVLLLMTLFLLFGGRTLERFQGQAQPAWDEGRAALQREAARLAVGQPWTGHGAGNFERIFTIARDPGPEQGVALHPESDWLWLAAEMGWPAVALVAAGLLVWLGQTWPFDAGSGRYLRSAAAVGGVAFALHGLVDVSGHRLGALWPALLLLSLARNRRWQPAADTRWAAPVFRVFATAMIALGGWWIYAAIHPERTLEWPTSSTAGWLDRAVDAELAAGDAATALKHAEAGTRIQPLNWSFHYQRAVALGLSGGDLQEVANSFDRARFLQPRYAELTMREGIFWLELNEVPMTLNAWAETLHRAGPRAPGFFDDMLRRTWRRTDMRQALAAMARTDPALRLLWLEGANRFEFEFEANRLLAADPELKQLTPIQRQTFFRLWSQRGDPAALVEFIRQHPEWMEEAWLGIARYYARQGDFERAWDFADHYGAKPLIPQIATGKSVAELERGFTLRQDLLDGLALFLHLRTLRQNEDALTTLLSLSKLDDHPTYIPYLEAQMRAERREWQLAWQAWERYAATLK